MQTTDRDAPPRASLMRRLFLGPPESETISSTDPPQRVPELIDIRPVTEPDIQTIYFRLERLEEGSRLIAETLKRAFGELTASMDAVRASVATAATSAEVDRAVAEATTPLQESMRRVADAVDGFPHVLAAAADHISDRVEVTNSRLPGAIAQRLAEAKY
jgi:hypothetical protein